MVIPRTFSYCSTFSIRDNPHWEPERANRSVSSTAHSVALFVLGTAKIVAFWKQNVKNGTQKVVFSCFKKGKKFCHFSVENKDQDIVNCRRVVFHAADFHKNKDQSVGPRAAYPFSSSSVSLPPSRWRCSTIQRLSVPPRTGSNCIAFHSNDNCNAFSDQKGCYSSAGVIRIGLFRNFTIWTKLSTQKKTELLKETAQFEGICRFQLSGNVQWSVKIDSLSTKRKLKLKRWSLANSPPTLMFKRLIYVGLKH